MVHRIVYGLIRIFSAVLVFGLLSFYVWCGQLLYDRASHVLARVGIYALLILGAGLSYDCGKAVLLIPQVKVRSAIVEPLAVIAAILGISVVTTLFSVNAWPLSAMVTYVLGLGFMLFGMKGTHPKRDDQSFVPSVP